MKYMNQWSIPSDSNPSRNYTVSLTYDGEWQCSCIGWTRHVPRKDCKHIRRVKEDPEILNKGVRFATVNEPEGS
jgi:hypothetical protein